MSAAISHLQSPISGDSPLDVLLVLRARAEQYPSFINQANMLSGAGLRVGVLHLASPGTGTSPLAASVRQWVAHRSWNSRTEPRPFLGRRLLNAVRFAWACRSAMRRSRPAVVLGHEPLACAHLAPQSVHHHTIYHFHELPETYPGMGVGARLAYGKATRNSRQVDLVIFSDGMRARRYQTEAELPARPSVVMNCPRRMDKVPSSPLRQQLALNTQHSTLNLQPFTQLVCYLGSIGSNQGLPEAALSMRYWPPDSVFLLIGPYSEALQRRIVDNARAVGAEHRVLFLGAKPHQQALALAAGAGLGLSLIQPNSPNLLYSAGAVNKRFEYMALGVPQITNNGPGVADIIERNQCGLCVDPNRPEEVGAAVNRLLRNPALLRQMGKNGRRLHLARYSYEVEFGPVQQQIARWCAGEEPGGLGSP